MWIVIKLPMSGGKHSSQSSVLHESILAKSSFEEERGPVFMLYQLDFVSFCQVEVICNG